MSKAWPNDVREAMWALRCDGLKPKEITRLLNNGDAGLERKVPIPYLTVVDILAKMKKARGEPETFITQGRELDAAGSLRRKALEMAKREIDALGEKESLTEREVKHLIQLAKLVDDIEARLREREKEPAKQKGSGRAPDWMKKIARSEEARKRDDDAGEPSPAGASSEPPTPDTPGPASGPPPAQESREYETSGVPWPE